MMKNKTAPSPTTCYHCGEPCSHQPVDFEEKSFCCDGCKMVFEILNNHGLCNYYNLSNHPGIQLKSRLRQDKFAFLDDSTIKQSLIAYQDEAVLHVSFYLPQIHCSSCLWLLENLHHIDEHIISSKVDFGRKEIAIIFHHAGISLRAVAELLCTVGYEPYISLKDSVHKHAVVDKSKTYKLGVAGFCFANIMLLSFPEYFGISIGEENYVHLFRSLNLVLSLPVLLYSATEFYNTAWKSLRKGFLHIDAPIVLAIWITFSRSLYEVMTGKGSGYFDSMTGIVFFMLIGRVLQDKTYRRLIFDRDYTSYFPIASTKLVNGIQQTVPLSDIQLNDTLLIHNEELIPADGIVTSGKALIDYSFVTGESMPVQKEMGEIIYAGGKQMGNNMEMLVIKEVAQSYLTSLWNRSDWKEERNSDEHSFVHVLSKYFTWGVLAVASFAAWYWWQHDVSKVWSSVTAVLIIACPCALLLSNTFTNGNVLRLLSRNHFYLRNAQAIENIALANHIVFDKTGTLTTRALDVHYGGTPLTKTEEQKIAALAAQSNHPLSKALVQHMQQPASLVVTGFKEIPGLGIEGFVGSDLVSIGSKKFVSGSKVADAETTVHVSIEANAKGKFVFSNQYRPQILSLIRALNKQYALSVLSGDNDGERKALQNIFGMDADLHFHQQPADKLEAIKQLQQQGKRVIMLGDGLNDAGALKQANVGIAVSDDTNNFTPASDAILEAKQLPLLYKFISLCKANKKIVMASFAISLCYNMAGLYFAVQGSLAPVIAAVLMPLSSLTILLITFGASSLWAYKLKL